MPAICPWPAESDTDFAAGFGAEQLRRAVADSDNAAIRRGLRGFTSDGFREMTYGTGRKPMVQSGRSLALYGLFVLPMGNA